MPAISTATLYHTIREARLSPQKFNYLTNFDTFYELSSNLGFICLQGVLWDKTMSLELFPQYRSEFFPHKPRCTQT